MLFAIFKKMDIKPENRLKFTNEIAQIAGITEEIQKANIEKYAKRGRKVKIKNKI